METLEDDTQYIFTTKEMNGILEFPISNTNNIADQSTEDIKRKYFDQLPRDKLFELYQIYQLDFEMFGYSVEPYL